MSPAKINLVVAFFRGQDKKSGGVSPWGSGHLKVVCMVAKALPGPSFFPFRKVSPQGHQNFITMGLRAQTAHQGGDGVCFVRLRIVLSHKNPKSGHFRIEWGQKSARMLRLSFCCEKLRVKRGARDFRPGPPPPGVKASRMGDVGGPGYFRDPKKKRQ